MYYKSGYGVKKMILISVLSGIIGFLFSKLGIEARVGSIDVSIPLSLIFPLMAAIAFGSRYGIVAGLAGGAYFPFLLWPNNGIPNVTTALIFLAGYFMIGLLHNNSFWGKQKKDYFRIIAILAACITLFAFYFLFLFEILFSLNPVLGFNNARDEITKDAAFSILVKESINLILLTFVALTLLELAWVRKALGMPFEPTTKPNTKILIYVILASVTIWITLAGLGYAMLKGDNAFTSLQLNLILMVVLASGFVVAKVLFQYNMSKLKIENELKEREEKLKIIIATSPDGLAISDMDGNAQYLSPQFLKMFGYSNPEEVTGRNAMEFLHPDYYQKAQCNIAEMMKGNLTGPAEYVMLKKHGTEFFVEVNANVLRDVDNKPIGVLYFERDITDRKQAELFLKDIIDKNPLSIQIVDTEGYTLQTNAAYNKLFGGVPPPDYSIFKNKLLMNQGFVEVFKQIKAGEEVQFPDFHFNAHDISPELSDKPLWIRLVMFPLFDRVANQERYVFMYEDITDRKLFEEKLKTSDRIFYHSLDMLCIIGFDGYFKVLNPAWEKTLGWSNDELLKKPWVEFVHPDDKIATENIKSVIVDGKEIYQITNRYICKDGKIKWLSWNSFPYHEEGIMYGVARDNTENKKIEIELLAAKEKAEESDRLKSAFLANMSHEIRTPMNGILGFSELLKSPGLSSETQQEYIEIIEKSGTRMLNIINDIVSISKIESGLMTVNWQESNINEQIEYIYTFFKPEVEGKGMQLSFNNSLPSKEAILKTDREKVFAILTNLVKNAIKYSEKGSIEFGYNKKDKSLEFYIKDTGIGIMEDRQEAIFERFIQADIADKMARQGAGLGLSISKAYVEMLGGKIWLESTFGKGSTFYFTLPYQSENLEEKTVKNKVLTPANVPLFKKLKILIADDDGPSEMLITIMVQGLGSEVINVRTGIEAVSACSNHPDIDLVLMDILMPEMNGYEATRQIREFNEKVIIIAQTANALEGENLKAIAAGCNGYISKPISKDKIKQLIIKHLNKI